MPEFTGNKYTKNGQFKEDMLRYKANSYPLDDSDFQAADTMYDNIQAKNKLRRCVSYPDNKQLRLPSNQS